MHARTGTVGIVAVLSLGLLQACDEGRILRPGADVPGTLDVQFGDAGADADGPRDDAGDDLPPADAPGDLPADLPGDAPADVPQDAPADAPADAPGDAPDDLPPADVPGDLPPEETPADVPSDVTADDMADAGPDVPDPESVTAWDPWDRVERFRFDNPGLVPETHIDLTAQTDTRVFGAFGTNKPGPGLVLLHSAKGWDQGGGPVVVLVHGAGSNADQSFAEPDALSDDSLVKALSAAPAFRVFAVTFPHPFGDNDNQALQLAFAISVVKARTGVSAVDVVAHSKGGLALMAYLKGRGAGWGVPFAGDVARAVFLGAPLGGMDWSFRHPNASWTAQTWSLPMPTAWDQVLEYGLWKDITERSIYGGAYVGLLQALWPWDEVHALSMVEQDWYTTYYGGQGFVSHSKGIHEAVVLGGTWMQALKDLPAPSSVAVAAGVGGSAWVNGVLWEATGPSDGMVFEASAGDLSAFEDAGATILGTETFGSLNHWELLYGDDATAFVRDVLGRE